MATFSYCSVLQVQCPDGVIQIIAGSFEEQVLLNLQESLTKSVVIKKECIARKLTEIVGYICAQEEFESLQETVEDDGTQGLFEDAGVLLDTQIEDIQQDPEISVVEIITHENNENFNDVTPDYDFVDGAEDHDDDDYEFIEDQVNEKMLEKFVEDTFKDDIWMDNESHGDSIRIISRCNKHTSTRKLSRSMSCPYKCGFCEDVFTKQTFLRSHIMVMHPDKVDLSNMPSNINAFRCTYCNRAFDRMPSLTRHFVVHTNDKPYKCDGHCGKTFGSSKLLERHTLRYKGIFNHVCTICGKKWLMKKDLKSHMVTHTDQRPFQCPECGKSFARNTELTQHVQFHDTSRPHTCATCGKSFKRKRDLTKHGLVHDPDRKTSHVCHICNKGFVRLPTLQKHLQQHYKYT